MRSRTMLVVAILLSGTAAGCASSTDWQDWRGHPTHFASGNHGVFSLRNSRDGSNPRVTRDDLASSQTESWWGRVITVSPDQLFEPR